jgi:hypothetical protein
VNFLVFSKLTVYPEQEYAAKGDFQQKKMANFWLVELSATEYARTILWKKSRCENPSCKSLRVLNISNPTLFP